MDMPSPHDHINNITLFTALQQASGLAPASEQSSTASQHNTIIHQASTHGSRFNKTDHIAYFNWSPSNINNLIDIIYNNDHYQCVLLPGRLTAEQEKVKTKICWLTEQYNNIKKTISQQTSAGVLLQDMDHNSLDYATCESIARSCPWFEHWHKMMTNCAQTGPVVLLTGHPYDATPASSQNNSVDANVNMDDASDAHYPQRCNIPGMESILEDLQNDPIGAKVISSFSSSVAATPAAASSSSHSPFSSSSNLSSIGPTPFTITPIDTPTCQRSSSTAFEADEVDNGDGDSVYHSPATGTTPKKSQPFTSKSK
ncbi:hypothetical protein NDA10_003169 [Ustilago hordei]|nr:hypothetical protein NDA10_003169 [Ustilago hordei]KAJ1587231.1 hypothetical protein NDA15_003385 [Ustilago hordei]